MVADGELETAGAWKWIAPPPPPPIVRKGSELNTGAARAVDTARYTKPDTLLAPLASIDAPALTKIDVLDWIAMVPAVANAGRILTCTVQLSVTAFVVPPPTTENTELVKAGVVEEVAEQLITAVELTVTGPALLIVRIAPEVPLFSVRDELPCCR
jgi:hypothetical protein